MYDGKVRGKRFLGNKHKNPLVRKHGSHSPTMNINISLMV